MAGSIGYYAERFAAGLSHFPRTLRLAWTAARGWVAAWIVLLLLQGLLPLGMIHLTRRLVDALAHTIGSGGADAREVWYRALALAALLLLGELLRAISHWVRAAQAEAVKDHIADLIHRKSIEVDLAFYEAPEFYDHLHRAQMEAPYRPPALIESLGSLLQSTITFAAMLAVLASFGFWIPAALIAGTLPALAVLLRYTIRNQQLVRQQTADERRAWYNDWLLTTREPAAEVRLFQSGDHFREAYRSLRGRLRGERLSLLRSQSMAELAVAVLGYAIYAAALLWVVRRAVAGEFTVGQLVLLAQSFFYGQQLLRASLDNVNNLYANSLFLGHLYEFLELKPQITSVSTSWAVPPLQTDLAFHDVTFRYPGAATPALQDFHLSIPAGRITAIVGPNGAGKSTLLKLACRLYDPDAGRVEWDGADLRDLQLNELRQRITVLFQEPVHYNATVAENVALGDLQSPPEPGRVQEALREAGAQQIVERLPVREQSLLGKRFADGSELSAGEWQRLCLARAFYRKAPLLLLDEPTSAMDSWAENEWMSRFAELAAGRTVLLITHRFTTAMRADIIHVMQQGQIVESGTHTQLIAAGGLYAASWTAQAR